MDCSVEGESALLSQGDIVADSGFWCCVARTADEG